MNILDGQELKAPTTVRKKTLVVNFVEISLSDPKRLARKRSW